MPRASQLSQLYMLSRPAYWPLPSLHWPGRPCDHFFVCAAFFGPFCDLCVLTECGTDIRVHQNILLIFGIRHITNIYDSEKGIAIK